MLLRPDARGILAIGQSSHAWISGQLARSWGNHRFAGPEPWEDVCLAAEQHDIGMAEWDLEPDRDPATGLPYSFTEMPLELHIALWSAGPRKLLTQSRYAALLVSIHGSRLYRRRDLAELSERDAERVRMYLAGEEAFQQKLLDSLGDDPATVAASEEALVTRNSQLIWIWDFISLALCLGWAPRPVRDAPTVDGPVDLELAATDHPGRLSLEPWPFARERVSVRCQGRRLDGPHATDDALREALAAAPWETVAFELVRGR
jgi:hypothetical protein